MRREIRIAGFGGQGVISIGILLAKGAGCFAGLHVAQTQSYGPESRGGACKTDVVLSDECIDYIKPLNPDTLLVMSQPALNRYERDLEDTGLLLVDTAMVRHIPERFTTVWSLPAVKLAENAVGLRIAANSVMFGALARATGLLSAEICKKILADTFTASMLCKNLEAFSIGFDQVRAERGTV
ncbi:MAG: 2-oxoacid:acceptor oxidoreductase family protein [Desulfovibrio sp.]|jgi:2-oxoglutarate ferredoxin oxidoreductase subunit gamma|nr:2-oxoacid:acceptor oxidoreductase family protein [Desulfovibrio sp.]